VQKCAGDSICAWPEESYLRRKRGQHHYVTIGDRMRSQIIERIQEKPILQTPCSIGSLGLSFAHRMVVELNLSEIWHQ
jgi:hypothetical protein